MDGEPVPIYHSETNTYLQSTSSSTKISKPILKKPRHINPLPLHPLQPRRGTRQVGFGLGLSASAIDTAPKVTEHVILEANEMVMAKVAGCGAQPKTSRFFLPPFFFEKMDISGPSEYLKWNCKPSINQS